MMPLYRTQPEYKYQQRKNVLFYLQVNIGTIVDGYIPAILNQKLEKLSIFQYKYGYQLQARKTKINQYKEKSKYFKMDFNRFLDR